ncbi:MAG: hypothetical protein WDZ79_02745 [Candidatus Paceibacterota bacterium]
MNVTVLREANRFLLNLESPVRFWAQTPYITSSGSTISSITHDARPLIGANNVADDTAYVCGVMSQGLAGRHLMRGNNLYVDAHCFVGVESDLPRASGALHARRVAANGVRRMTMMLFVNCTVSETSFTLLRTSINRTLSVALGTESLEWFASPDTDTFTTSSGLIVCSPPRGVHVQEQHLTERGAAAALTALVDALRRYSARIS